MMRMLECLWASAALVDAPIERYDESEEETEECAPPTLPSVLSADRAFELANEATAQRDFESAKLYMQYYHHKTREM